MRDAFEKGYISREAIISTSTHTIVPVLRLGVKQETLPFACTWPTISILVERLVENELFDSTLAAKFLSQDEERKKGQIHTSVFRFG